MQLERLFWTVLAGLACALAATIFLLGTGRAVPIAGLTFRSAGRGSGPRNGSGAQRGPADHPTSADVT